MNVTTQACAGGIVFDSARRLLVIRRANPPGEGLWSVPGGRCHPGEPRPQACVREVAEETGLHVEVVRTAGSIMRAGPAGVGYDITDYLCRVVGGELAAGDDATDVRWATMSDLEHLELVPELLECLAEWSLLPD